MELTAALNQEQEQACTTLTGPLMVLAGPGTGKTRVIAHRYLNLLSQPGVATDNILVLTFTDKAAREMESRIAQLCNTGYTDLWVGTFHAFANRFLRAEGRSLPIPQPFRIASDVDRWDTLGRVLERLRPTELYHLPRPRDIVSPLLKLFERAKQEMSGADEYVDAARGMIEGHELGAELQAQVATVYATYQDELVKQGMLDFDDMVYWSVRLLEKDGAILQRYQAQFEHVMVDEFQDTNYAQLRLVELLAGDRGSVAVVGDDDQSIYKFRGASVANLRRFRKRYPGLAIVRLQANYRSTTEVLDVAQRMIERNTERIGKQVVSDRQGPRPRLYGAPDMRHEVAWVVERMAELIEGGMPAGEIALLVRNNAHLRPFIRALQRAGIPYQLYGGSGFLAQPEIKDLRALVQWVVDPADAQAACRVLAMPGVALPGSLVLDVARAAARQETTIEAVLKVTELETAAAATVARVLAMLDELRALSMRQRADEVLFAALEMTRYLDVLDYPEIQRRQVGANLTKLSDLVDAFCEADPSGASSTLAALVRHLDAIEESASEQGIAPIEAGEDAVQLMTVHKAKGLEFTAVFCPDMVEDRFPYNRQPDRLVLPPALIREEAPSRDAHIAEERRLAYVAGTRARSHLFFSSAERYEGGKRWKPSRFLVDMGLLPGPDGSIAFPPTPEPVPGVEPEPEPAVAQAALPMSHPDVPELTASYSQLAEYQRCPRAYQYRHVYTLPVRQSPEQQFGIIVHETLRRLLLLPGPGQPPVEEAVALYDSVFGEHVFCDPVNADLWRDRGRDFIVAMHRRGRLDPASLHCPPEQAFNLRLAGFRVRGRIDRIDRTREGYRVIDYKTGEPKQEWELERDLQLGLYAMAAQSVLGLKPVELAICYIDDATEIPVMKTTSQLEVDLEAAQDAAAGIMAEDFHPTPGTWKCRNCDFRVVCDAAL